MDGKILFPRNSSEWQEYVSLQRQIRKADITNQQQFNPKQGTFLRETRPVAPASSSKNWNEALWKGYETQSDLSTYIIPRHEQLKLALFSRHILKDPNAVDSDYLERAQQKFQQLRPYQSIKDYANHKKNNFNTGGVLMNPTQQTTDGVPEELKARYFELNAPNVPTDEIF